MKKVLFITNLPSPYRVDFYNELGKYLDLTVAFEARRSKDLTYNWNDETIQNFKPVYLDKGYLNEKKLNSKIFALLKPKKYDIRVISCYHTRSQTFAILYMKLMGIPYCFETDGGIINQNERGIVKRIKKFLISGAKVYFSPSRGSDEYLEYYGAKKENVYRYPFTSLWENDIINKPLNSTEKKEIKNKLGIAEEKMLITVGQFIKRKGFDVLLRSLKDVNCDTTLGVYIVGGKPIQLYKYIENELGLKNVHYIDFKTKDELSEYFKAADVFVLPTREDIWGLVINEAMGHALPVITTDNCVAGIELLQDKDCIIPVEDEKTLAVAINKIINDDTYALKLSENNLESIRKNTFESMAKAHIEHL